MTTDELGIPEFLDRRAKAEATAAARDRDGLDCPNPTNPSSDDEKAVDGLDCPNPSPGEIVRLGQAAMARLARSWDDWMLVAAALDVGRTEVMRNVHTNEPTGRRYERAMADWLAANNFQQIDKGDRSRLLHCLKHREQIERWRAALTNNQRTKLNHPTAVLRKWQKSISPPVPNPKPKLTPIAKRDAVIVTLEEENARMRREIERGGGDCWDVKDTAHAIADTMLRKLGPAKLKGVLREAAKLIKAAERQ